MKITYRYSSVFQFLITAILVILVVVLAMTDEPYGQELSQPLSIEASRAPRTEAEQMIIDAYRRAQHAVVNVTTETGTYDFFRASSAKGSGSGVIIDADRALVITNYHVIAGSKKVMVSLSNGQSYHVQLIGHDEDNDLALLRIDNPPSELVAVPLGDSSTIEVGQRVLAIGSPFGLSRTLTVGIVSSVGRAIRSENGRLMEDIIQTDAAINPGNSGGPLLDTAGRLVGLNTAIVSRTGENAGIGFASPANRIKEAVPQLIKYGRVLRPKIGVILANTEYGPVLLYVHSDSPAEKAGLQSARRHVRGRRYQGYVIDAANADFILAVNGKKVLTKSDVIDELGRVKHGVLVELKVRRGIHPGKVRSVKIKPELA